MIRRLLTDSCRDLWRARTVLAVGYAIHLFFVVFFAWVVDLRLAHVLKRRVDPSLLKWGAIWLDQSDACYAVLYSAGAIFGCYTLASALIAAAYFTYHVRDTNRSLQRQHRSRFVLLRLLGVLAMGLLVVVWWFAARALHRVGLHGDNEAIVWGGQLILAAAWLALLTLTALTVHYAQAGLAQGQPVVTACRTALSLLRRAPLMTIGTWGVGWIAWTLFAFVGAAFVGEWPLLSQLPALARFFVTGWMWALALRILQASEQRR